MNNNKIFEPPFNFEEYIEQRLLEINDLNERSITRNILYNCVMQGIKYSEHRYSQLEERIFNEVENISHKYNIYSTIIEKELYDETNSILFPVDENDLKSVKHDMNVIYENIQKHGKYTLYSICIKTDRTNCSKLIKHSKKYKGKLITNKTEYEAYFTLEKDMRYKNHVNDLYQLFIQNGIKWSTVNEAYFDKFFYVNMEIPNISFNEDEIFVDAIVNFESLSNIVYKNIIPIWNIRKIKYDSFDFIMPCINGIDYEHEFLFSSYGLDNGYLIEKNQYISGIRHEKEKAIIKTPVEIFDKWIAYSVINNMQDLKGRFSNKILSNNRKKTFTDGFINKFNTRLQTNGEINRILNQYTDYTDICYVGAELIHRTNEKTCLAEMNWFINDDILNMDSRNILLLRFKVDDKNYLTEDFVNFLVSEVQLNFNEYRCEGLIV